MRGNARLGLIGLALAVMLFGGGGLTAVQAAAKKRHKPKHTHARSQPKCKRGACLRALCLGLARAAVAPRLHLG